MRVGLLVACAVLSTLSNRYATAGEIALHLKGGTSPDRDHDAPFQSQVNWVGPHLETNRTIEKSLKTQVQAMMDGLSQDAKEGYRHLTESSYLPSDFDAQVLEYLEQLTDTPPLQDRSPPTDRRLATWDRFGLASRPGEPEKPLQYVVTQDRQYVMNCFACHGGNLLGVTYPGAPNTLYALESLTEEVRRVKLQLKKPLGHMEIGSMAMPLGTSVGTSNAVMFGVALMNYRDKDLNIFPFRLPAPMTHHDMEAPPWWHFAKKSHIYIDGFAEKGHRGLMQFMLVKETGPEQFRGWEEDFKKVYAFLSELKPPKYPLPIDEVKSLRGAAVFNSHCADCHGTYGANASYPQRLVSLSELGTDPVRSHALTTKHRAGYGNSWFADYGGQDTKVEVDGYIAPPLDGLWASAPYMHNGSVPTLWHVLHPEARPAIWKRTRLGLDVERMGLDFESVAEVPRGLKLIDRRWYFDTRQFGKSNRGHDYPNALTEAEKSDLLEYLKTL